MGRVAVVGSLNLDMVVRAARLPDPGETLHGESYQTFPGGKGLNQAAAACRAGAAVALVGRLGADDAGRMLRGVLEHEGIDTRHVLDDARVGTGIAVIQLDAAGQNTIIVVPRANAALSAEDVAAASAVVAAADVVLVQAEAPPAACLRAAEIAHAAGRTVVFNPAPAPPPAGGLERLLAISDYVLPNETELRALTGETDAERGARRLRRRTRGTVIVTLGERGALLCTAPAAPVEVVAAPKVDVVDTVGAGDAFAGVFAAALAENGSLNVALRRGLAAGALACTRAGALPSMPSRDEILRRTREA